MKKFTFVLMVLVLLAIPTTATAVKPGACTTMKSVSPFTMELSSETDVTS